MWEHWKLCSDILGHGNDCPPEIAVIHSVNPWGPDQLFGPPITNFLPSRYSRQTLNTYKILCGFNKLRSSCLVFTLSDFCPTFIVYSIIPTPFTNWRTCGNRREPIGWYSACLNWRSVVVIYSVLFFLSTIGSVFNLLGTWNYVSQWNCNGPLKDLCCTYWASFLHTEKPIPNALWHLKFSCHVCSNREAAKL